MGELAISPQPDRARQDRPLAPAGGQCRLQQHWCLYDVPEQRQCRRQAPNRRPRRPDRPRPPRHHCRTGKAFAGPPSIAEDDTITHRCREKQRRAAHHSHGTRDRTPRGLAAQAGRAARGRWFHRRRGQKAARARRERPHRGHRTRGSRGHEPWQQSAGRETRRREAHSNWKAHSDSALAE